MASKSRCSSLNRYLHKRQFSSCVQFLKTLPQAGKTLKSPTFSNNNEKATSAQFYNQDLQKTKSQIHQNLSTNKVRENQIKWTFLRESK